MILDQVQMQQAIAVIGGVMILNIFLSALKASLEKIKDKTKSKVDNKAWAIVKRLLVITGGILDVLSANIEHKNQEPPK